ncbi:hypothetical protein B0H10DRAFT_1961422 [Mycena sp. CBHHK59/15]|nr:hypothetical protein B0H10DRAFT_1961422 [Mycena sp. CBHHK59/15]
MAHNAPQRSTGTSGPQAGCGLTPWAHRAELAGMHTCGGVMLYTVWASRDAHPIGRRRADVTGERREGDVAGVDAGMGASGCRGRRKGSSINLSGKANNGELRCNPVVYMLETLNGSSEVAHTTPLQIQQALPQAAGKHSAMRASLVLEGGAVQPRRLLAQYMSCMRDTRGIARGVVGDLGGKVTLTVSGNGHLVSNYHKMDHVLSH